MDLARLILGVDTRQLRDGERDMRSFGSTARGVASSVTAAFAAIGVGFGVSELIRTADAYSGINAQLRLVTKSAGELAAVEKQLFAISQANRVGFESTVDLYSRIARSTETLGVSQSEVLRVTEAINRALIISGTSAGEASGSLMQLGQAFASGTLRGDELNSILEGMPRVAQAIAEGMGVTVGQLRELGAQGELTSEQVFRALLKMSADIESEFGKMPVTVGQAFTTVQNSLLRMIGVFDQQNAVSSEFAQNIVGISQAIDRAGPSFRTLINSVSVLAGGFLAYRAVILTVAAAQAAYTGAMIVATRIIGGVQAATLGLNAALISNPFTAVAAAVGILTGAFIALAQSQSAARAETDNLIRSLKAAAQARSADFAAERSKLQYRIQVLEGRSNRVETFGERAVRAVGGGFALQAANAEETKELIRLRQELVAADKAYQDAGKAAQNMAVPTGGATAAVAGLGKELKGASGSASQAADDFQRLYDRLFPYQAMMRQFDADAAALARRLSGPELEEALKRLDRERVASRTRNLGPAEVSQRLLGEGPLVDLKKQSQEYLDEVDRMRDKTRSDTVTIAESFAQMSRNITSSLQGLANSIRSGDILGILGGVLDIFTSLGSAGVFGKGLQTRLNQRSFDGGGYTGSGSRSGGLDGKGGFLAMLHPNETVIDHHRGQRVPANDTRVHVTVGIDQRNGNVLAFVDGRIAATAPIVANAGAQQAMAQSAAAARRRVR